jgi:hypothetical protein
MLDENVLFVIAQQISCMIVEATVQGISLPVVLTVSSHGSA